jgi:hypothetical protein
MLANFLRLPRIRSLGQYLNVFKSYTRPEEAEWSENVKQMCNTAAREFGVSPEVHSCDHIFRFVLGHPGFNGDAAAAIQYYFRDGHNSAVRVGEAFHRWVCPSIDSVNVLEFASGYGAVTRHVKDILAPNVLYSCDIHLEAVQFLSRTLNVPAIRSTDVPERLNLPVSYDMIFVLSFFSHMPASTWGRWLRRLYSALNGNGVLLFTTHGRKSMKHFPQACLSSEGFWFERSSEQKDLDTATYGQTITTRPFVEARINDLHGAQLLDDQEGAWWGHQDLYVVRKCCAA